MSPTILILGATGKTGRRLLPLLAGCDIRAASRSGAPGTVAFDWADDKTHEAALAGVDSIYLIAPDVADPTTITGPFLERASRAGISRAVLLSSLGVTFPEEPEGSARLRLERQVMEAVPEWTILRPSGFDQNFSEGFLLPGILQANAVISATGDGRAGWVDAGDIAAVAAAALTNTSWLGKHLAITGPRAIDFAEIAKIISGVAGRDIAYNRVDEDAFRGILIGAGASPEYAEIPVRDQRAICDGNGALITDTVEQVTGRSPISFEAFAQAVAATWRSN